MLFLVLALLTSVKVISQGIPDLQFTNAVLESGQIYCVQCPEGSSYKIIDGRSWCVK